MIAHSAWSQPLLQPISPLNSTPPSTSSVRPNGAMLLLAVASGSVPQISSCNWAENIANWWLWVHSRLMAQAVLAQAPAKVAMHSANAGRLISRPP